MRKLPQPPRGDIAKRLKRAAGHLNATIAMLERQRPCLDLAQQLSAVEAAVVAARRQVVGEQLQICLDGGDVDGSTLRQLKALARFL
ncbi:MAG: metal-sensing transcriptional repressor [Hyphomonadaceae bacterium]